MPRRRSPPGMAATMAVFQSLAPGDHVILPTSVYYGTRKLIDQVFARWGLTMTSVDMRERRRTSRRRCGRTTRLVWVESPSNPLLAVADIERIAAIAHDAGARCAVDNTWATPVAQQPLALGADLVMHSTTKYLGGHGDVTGGALVAREDDEFFQRVRTVQTAGGAVAAPFDCWLVVRGIKTLPYRIRAHTANATAVAEFLASHPNVEAVHYPGTAIASGSHDRDASDVGVRRDGFGTGARRARGVASCEESREGLHARDEPRRPREPGRTPGIGGGARTAVRPTTCFGCRSGSSIPTT